MSVSPGAAGSGVLPFADGHPSLARCRGFASEDAARWSGAGWRQPQHPAAAATMGESLLGNFQLKLENQQF